MTGKTWYIQHSKENKEMNLYSDKRREETHTKGVFSKLSTQKIWDSVVEELWLAIGVCLLYTNISWQATAAITDTLDSLKVVYNCLKYLFRMPQTVKCTVWYVSLMLNNLIFHHTAMIFCPGISIYSSL